MTIRHAALVFGKSIGSCLVLACLAGLPLHFHITTYAYLAAALAGSCAIYLWTRPSRQSLVCTVVLGAAFAIFYAIVTGEPVLPSSPAFLGLGSLASLALAALWSTPERRSANLDTCTTAALFPMFLITSGLALGMTTALHPKTFDLFLYAFDARLGMQPSFLVGRFFARFHAIRYGCYLGYEALPLAMAIAFAMERSRRARRSSSLMLAFMIAAVGGFVLYNLFPAVGPIHVFGKQFPNLPPPAGPAPFHLVAIESAPRNAMPSVHIAMALLILWNSRLGPRVWRMVAAMLLGVTVLATLGFGEHYLVDLFVAVPFTLAAQGLATASLPWRTSERIAATAVGGALVAGWLMYLRMPTPAPAGGGWAWSLLLGTAVVAVVLEWRLNRVTLALNYQTLRQPDVARFEPACAPYGLGSRTPAGSMSAE
jgi:hypothetical protein